MIHSQLQEKDELTIGIYLINLLDSMIACLFLQIAIKLMNARQSQNQMEIDKFIYRS